MALGPLGTCSHHKKAALEEARAVGVKVVARLPLWVLYGICTNCSRWLAGRYFLFQWSQHRSPRHRLVDCRAEGGIAMVVGHGSTCEGNCVPLLCVPAVSPSLVITAAFQVPGQF
jgi:hypothetical protein